MESTPETTPKEKENENIQPEALEDAEGFLNKLTGAIESGDIDHFKDLASDLMKDLKGDMPANYKEAFDKVTKGDIDLKAVKEELEKSKPEEESSEEEEEKEPEVEKTPEEKMKELKQKMRNKRQEMISKRKAKAKTSKQSGPLTPVVYCDAPGCKNIMHVAEAKTCPTCQSFNYCNAECQKLHWDKHKLMCGKNATEESRAKIAIYERARIAVNTIYDHVKDGEYTTVVHEQGNAPSCIFCTLATEKSNVLNWKTYLKNPLFTTSDISAFGTLAEKIRAAMDAFPDKKIFVITCIFDRLSQGQTTEAIVRVYIADTLGNTMSAPGGKITKQVVKYKRK
jgi:hypothetical protein